MADFQYVNLIMNYDPQANMGLPVPANVTAEFTQPILRNPKEYYLAVTRLYINSFNCPLIIPQVVLGQSNPLLTVYKVALGYNGQFVSAPILYQTSDGSQPTPQPPLTKQDFSSTYYYSYTYATFLTMVNNALATAFSLLVSPPVGSTAPEFYYDPSLGIVLKAQKANYQQTFTLTPNAGFIQIYVNDFLLPYVNGFSTMLIPNSTNCNNCILLYDQVINVDSTNTYWIQPNQNIQELSNYQSCKQFVITTNMPINTEFTQGNLNSYTITNSNLTTQTKILTDFDVDTSNPVGYNTVQIYTQNNSLRMIDFLTDKPLTQVDAQIYFVNAFNQSFPLLLTNGVSASIKYEFMKKSVYSK